MRKTLAAFYCFYANYLLHSCDHFVSGGGSTESQRSEIQL